jgi:hypothetical protein
MSDPNVIEGEATEVGPETEAGSKVLGDAKARATALKDAVGSLGKTVTAALQDRGNVVMVRVNDDALRHMDMLVDAEITKSRSESAAFLITEGVKANQGLFDKISNITEQIAKLRAKLRETVKTEPK